MSHVRIITQRASRRLMGSAGASHTLCGAPVTAYDLTPAEARKPANAGFLKCEQCRALLESSGARS